MPACADSNVANIRRGYFTRVTARRLCVFRSGACRAYLEVSASRSSELIFAAAWHARSESYPAVQPSVCLDGRDRPAPVPRTWTRNSLAAAAIETADFAQSAIAAGEKFHIRIDGCRQRAHDDALLPLVHISMRGRHVEGRAGAFLMSRAISHRSAGNRSTDRPGCNARDHQQNCTQSPAPLHLAPAGLDPMLRRRKECPASWPRLRALARIKHWDGSRGLQHARRVRCL